VKLSRTQALGRFHKIPEVEFVEDSGLTSYAGLVVFQALFAVLDLKRRLRACFSHRHPTSIYGQGTVVMLLVVHLLLGFRRLRNLDYYRDDPFVAHVLGLKRVPDVATVSRVLKSMDSISITKLRTLIRTLVLERLQREGMSRITVDFDGSVQSTRGHAEGTAVGFNKKKKGARSYYPLLCTVAQTGQFFDFHHRPGNVHDSNGAPEFMFESLDTLRSALPGVVLEARIDSAFFNDSVFPTLDALHVAFTCSVPFQRFTELKDLIESRQRWRRIDAEWSYFEFPWSPKCWERPYRLLCVRKRVEEQRKGPIQLDLFEPRSRRYDYTVIATNRTGSAKSVLLFHHGRGSQEKLFGEAKQHTGLDMIPTRRKNGNITFTAAGMIAHNLARELQMATYPADRGTLPKRPPRWDFMSIGTIRQRILHKAGTIRRPQGRMTLRMSANPATQIQIVHFLGALQKAA
jgi:hypothetical protein